MTNGEQCICKQEVVVVTSSLIWMANACSTKPTQGGKQQCLNTGIYHDRLTLDNNFEVIHTHGTHLTSARKIPIETQHSPLKGCTSWMVGNSWELEDSTEFGLDLGDGWCNEQLDASVIKASILLSLLKKRKQKSRVAVCSFYSCVMQHIYWLSGPSQHCLEGKILANIS